MRKALFLKDKNKAKYDVCRREKLYQRNDFMKKLVLITGIILMLCLFTSVYASVPENINTSTNTQTLDKTETDVFVMKSENNRIVVYKKGESAPFIKTDTLVSSLPRGDIPLLEKGIEINGEKNLQKALEDFCS